MISSSFLENKNGRKRGCCMGIRAVSCVVADMLLALTNLPTYLDVRKIRRNIYPELQVFDLVEDAAKVLMYGGMDVSLVVPQSKRNGRFHRLSIYATLVEVCKVKHNCSSTPKNVWKLLYKKFMSQIIIDKVATGKY